MVSVPGYEMSMEEMLTDISFYSPELLKYRWRISKKIYDPAGPLDDEELKDLFSNNDNLLIVVRQRELQQKFDIEGFEAVFHSSDNNFAVFQYKGPCPDDN